ncbi:DUF2975 domain-containing protein [Parabacteroides sp. PF5-9]|uniref:DUF2975 domain-containing protein n=1 Tax=Parabacteroides sp. PF5-9 TaxID=1742404 RepID=UPI002473AA24|nr:DUF2975 domain-containing protein [Parabacteroides sp. PF5-9]MDH6356321.1 hypothetical protein [Parabacteroides sp. PF5-9]
MKKRLNLIIMALAFTFGLQIAFALIVPIVELVNSTGLETQEEDIHDASHSMLTLQLDLKPNDEFVMTDSLFNQKSGLWLPAQFESVSLEIKEAKLSIVYPLILALVLLALIIMIIIYFIKLITAIQKSIIFDWINVKRLRYVGWGLILLFLVNTIGEFMLLIFAQNMIEIPGYHIDFSGALRVLNLVLGLIALLVAEIFAIGLNLKEEQELTI